MKNIKRAILHAIAAALMVLSAALFATAQTSPSRKENSRDGQAVSTIPSKPSNDEQANLAQFSYEFTQPAFQISHVVIEHDAAGKGKITFERKNSDPIVDPLELSPGTIDRLATLWKALRFLDSSISYQSEKHYPHLGTMRLQMKQDTRDRVEEFNWTSDKDVFALVTEYKRIANQAIFIFDITLARENQPLEAPKLMDQLDAYVRRNDIADARQLIPLLRELSTDERIPLMSRNSAARILKKIDK